LLIILSWFIFMINMLLIIENLLLH
jgi:hypothetical protein